MFHQLRIHADVGEARQGVDFVQNDTAILLQEEVYSRQALAAQCLVCLNSSFPQHIRLCIGNPCRNKELRSACDVFVFIVVKFCCRLDFSNIRCKRCIITEYCHFQFLAVNKFFNYDLAVMRKCNLNGFPKGFHIGCLVDTHRRACICRLYKHREAQCFCNCLTGFFHLSNFPLADASPFCCTNAIVVQNGMGHALIHAKGTAQSTASNVRQLCQFQ